MPYGYNSLNDTEIDDMKIGLCPICNKRLTAECEHSTTIESQEWLAAHIVAEQELYNERHPADVAQEIESRIDAELGHLPTTNANGNLQWQGVEFDIPAIVERTQAISAELKAQIDERAAVVKSLNSQAANNVRLGVKR